MVSVKKNPKYAHRRELNLAERVTIIRDYESSLRTGVIARKFNCSHHQVRSIIRRKDEYLALWEKNDDKQVVRRLRNPLLTATGTILYEWLLRARCYKDVTDDNLRETGRAIANHINYPEFKPNNRWLHRFKNKYRLNKLKPRVNRPGVSLSLKSLKIGDIINDVRRDDPNSLTELDEAKETAGINRDCLELSQLDEENSDNPSIEIRDLPDIPALLQTKSDETSSDHPSNDQGIDMDNADFQEAAEYEDGMEPAQEIETYQQAINLLKPIEQFVLLNENIRAVGLINQLENLFRDEISREEKINKTLV